MRVCRSVSTLLASVCMWAWFLFKSLSWARSYMSVCVSYAMEKSRSCVQMTDWKNQLAFEPRQKRSADRAAGWTVLVVGQSNVLLSYTHSRVQSVVRANLSSAPGYRAASIAALANFQLAQAERVQQLRLMQVKHSQGHACKRGWISFCSFHEWLRNTF